MIIVYAKIDGEEYKVGKVLNGNSIMKGSICETKGLYGEDGEC